MNSRWSWFALSVACGCAGTNGEGALDGSGGASSNSGGASAAQAGMPAGSAGATSVGGGSSGGVAGTSIGGTAGNSLAGAGMSGVAGSGGTTGGSGAEGGSSAGGIAGGGASGGGAAGSSSGGASPTGGTSGVGGVGTGGAAGMGGGISACATNLRSTCTGTNPIECHFGGNPGDYEVTVELGGDTAGATLVEAETLRPVLGSVATTAGQTQRFSFLVNVRQPEGQPIQAVPVGTPGLDLYFRGTTPRLSAICYQSRTPAPKVWIAGDSTVCDQSDPEYSGWAQHLPQFFRAPVSVANYADSGESSASFLGSSRLWGAIRAGWRSGDWVFIQLGHNDKDVTAAVFQSNITNMVTQAKSAGVSPILVTPISRVGYALADEHVNSTGANLPQIVRDIGRAQNVPVIDLTVTTWEWLQTVDWRQYFALGTDRTHTNPAGAEVIAGFVRNAIRSQGVGLAQYLR